MPEGDTIHRAASTLHRALAGKTVTAFRSPLPALATADLAGRRIAAVEAHGKNLMIRFDDGRVLHTHMMMTGSWHIYRPGEPWKKPARRARALLETEDFVAVCFNAPFVELLSSRQRDRHPALSRLGPDILKKDFDAEDACRRLRERGDTPIGEALIMQRLLAGVGNIYKSESLFLCGQDPFQPVAGISDAALERLIGKARELMAANLDGVSRETRRALDGGRYWVYRRSGRPCRRCGTRIQMRRQGAAQRSTYWCPQCQAGDDAENGDPGNSPSFPR